jgi:hypothetical protein
MAGELFVGAGHAAGEQDSGGELHGLEPLAQVEVVRAQLLDRRVRQPGRRRAAPLAGEEGRSGEHEGDLAALVRVGSGVVRLPQVLERGGAAGERLGQSELEQERGAVLGRRRLGQRAGEACGGVGGIALAAGAGRGDSQRVGHPLLTTRRDRQKLRGHALGRGSRLRENPGGARVEQLALARRDVVVDRVAHEGVHEGELRIAAEYLRVRELVGGAGRVLDWDLRYERRRGDLGAVAEDGDGTHEPPRLGGQARQPQQHRARDGTGAQLAHRSGIGGVWSDPLDPQCAHELAQEQRVAAGRRVAGGAERVVGRRAQRPPNHPRGRRLAQWGRAESSGPRVGGQVVDGAAGGLGLQRPERGEHEHGEVVQTPRQVGEVTL